MILKSFSAQNYRNIETCHLSFERGVNLLIGENAQGKTNALEGIYAFARGKSFRGAADAELVMFGKEGFVTEIAFEDQNRLQTLGYEFYRGSRKRYRNGVKMNKLSESLGHFRAVLFYPEHLQIIKGGPSERRELVNVAIAQLNGQYLRDYTAYQKILDNRNSLLKQAQKGGYVDESELLAWSEQLAGYAARIHTARVEYIRGLTPHAADYLRDISSEKEKLGLVYVSDTEHEDTDSARDDYFKLFSENLVRECAAGCTLFGVHRDDIEVTIGGKSARTYGSQGQQRSAVLAVKLAEGAYAKQITNDAPVYLFDDVLSELDERRRDYILSLAGENQLILTACDRHIKDGNYCEIEVTGGKYVPAHR